jgi:transcriptional regulator with XRE-family HTH domain
MKTIRQLRQERGWTQLELANRLGLTPSTIYNWERGKFEPTASVFRRIARVFEVPMEEIALIGIDVPDEGKGVAAA